jgi:uncharacterized membrane protein YhaH (DUF805 family)
VSQTQPVPPTEVPLDQPFYRATPVAAVRRFFAKYAVFSGRASRSEYWWWTLAGVAIGIVFEVAFVSTGALNWFVYQEVSYIARLPGMEDASGTLDVVRPAALSAGTVVVLVIYILFTLAILVPNLALTWRRLHDANYSGLFYLLMFVPFVGPFIVLVFTVLPPNPNGARFDRVRATA